MHKVRAVKFASTDRDGEPEAIDMNRHRILNPEQKFSNDCHAFIVYCTFSFACSFSFVLQLSLIVLIGFMLLNRISEKMFPLTSGLTSATHRSLFKYEYASGD